MSPLRWLLALPFLALLALFGSTGCGRAETDGEEQAVTAGALALTTDAVAFQIESLPPNMAAGVPGTMTVRALDANGDTATLYAGTVRFASSDLAALLPAPRTLQAGVATNVPITFVQSGAQTVTVSDSESPAITGTAGTTVSAATNSAITAPANVTAGATALAATTTNWNGATYTWTIWNGTLTAGQGTRAVTFTAGQTGTLTLGVIAVRNGAVRTGSRAIAVAAVPQTPSITAATAVAPSSTGNTAWVTAVTGMKYTWTVTRASITSSGGTSGVTSGGINKITYTSQATGPVVLSVVEKNAANATSAPATVSIPVVANAPRTPTITAASPVTEGEAGRTASVTARTGMSYVWTLLGGTITSPGGASGEMVAGKNRVTYTAGPAGAIAFTCKETNGTYFSAPALKSVTSIGAPQTPVVTAASLVLPSTPDLTASVPARADMTYSWSITGGTITSAAGGVTSNGVNTVTYTSGGPGILTLQAVELNAAGAASAPGVAEVTVSLAAIPPVQPAILTASPISAGASSTASVTARPGAEYAWTIVGGTITSPGGASGITSGGANTITFTAGPAGALDLACVEITGFGTSAPGTATVDVTAPPAASGEMYFIAHQDDDLLFMNPDIERSILAGRRTRAVFVTAGDPGTCTECWQARENGVWNAYSAMANVEKDWTCTPTAFGGKTVSACVLDTAPHVSVVFMRLPDGGLSSLWSTEVGPPFWVSPVASLTSVDNAYTVTRDEAITLIHDILADFHPAVVGAMDGSLAYGDDHYDHITVGLFGLDAALRHTDPIDFRFYRGYNIYGNWFNIPSPEPENLSPAEYAEKVRIMEAYAGGFPVDSDFDHWCHRRYAASSVVSGTGPLVTPGGKCLDTQAGGTQNGAPIQVRTCDESGGQIWSISPDGKVARATGRCLARSGATAVLADCATDATQQFKLFHNGQLRGASGACLTVSWDETSVGFEMCDADRTTDKYVPLPHQRFTQVFGASARWSQSTDFSDADVGGSRSYYATFDLGRLGADSRMDAFVRSAPGATTATNVGLGFGPIGGTPGAFGDAAGWLPEPYGTTVQLGDVSGDGIADVCGRSAAGIACAITEPTGALGAVTPWSTDFGDATFGGAAYYPSVRLGDVDGDGYADVCGRSSTGVVCARNTHAGSFAPATSWLAGDFTDAAGFDAAPCAGTLRLGDVNGDGKADVCMRGADGVRCAISNGSTAFTDAHLWSFRAEWSDAAGWSASAGRYGSLDLGDVNGDGKADLCGRATTGLVCAPSDGTAFEGAMPVAPFEYTDSLGWAAEPYGASLRLGELSGDARADVCGRDPGGLVCALAP